MPDSATSKPLNWKPDPNLGYSVTRRPDGGMYYTFTDVTPKTLEHWRDFAMEHLLDSDRLTRNLYDLRSLDELTDDAIAYAVEANTDPAARNIRLAVVVDDEAMIRKIREIPALSGQGGVEMKIFSNLAEAEAWLDRPLTLLT